MPRQNIFGRLAMMSEVPSTMPMTSEDVHLPDRPAFKKPLRLSVPRTADEDHAACGGEQKRAVDEIHRCAPSGIYPAGGDMAG